MLSSDKISDTGKQEDREHYLVCNLPAHVGGLSTNELRALIRSEGIPADKSNNYLRSKSDMCLALASKGSSEFTQSLRQSLDQSPRTKIALNSEVFSSGKRKARALLADVMKEGRVSAPVLNDPDLVKVRDQLEVMKGNLRDLMQRFDQQATARNELPSPSGTPDPANGLASMASASSRQPSLRAADVLTAVRQDSTNAAMLSELSRGVEGETYGEDLQSRLRETEGEVNQLRTTLAAVRTRYQQYIDVFPRIEDAVAFASQSIDLQNKASRLKQIVDAADAIAVRVHKHVERLSASATGGKQNQDDVIVLLHDLEAIVRQHEGTAGEVQSLSETLSNARSEIDIMRDAFVSLVHNVDRSVDAAKLDNEALTQILKDFIVRKTYLAGQLDHLDRTHQRADSTNRTVREGLDRIRKSVEALEKTGGATRSPVQSEENTTNEAESTQAEAVHGEDVLQLLTDIETRLTKLHRQQDASRAAFSGLRARFQAALTDKAREMQVLLDARTNEILSRFSEVQERLQDSSDALRRVMKELQQSSSRKSRSVQQLTQEASTILDEHQAYLREFFRQFQALDFTSVVRSLTTLGSTSSPPLPETGAADVDRINEMKQTIDQQRKELQALVDHRHHMEDELNETDLRLRMLQTSLENDTEIKRLTKQRHEIETQMRASDEEIQRLENEARGHEESIQQMWFKHDPTIPGAVGRETSLLQALRDAYEARMSVSLQGLERAKTELAMLNVGQTDDPEFLMHKEQLQNEATAALTRVTQELDNDTRNLQAGSTELAEKLRKRKQELLEKEKEWRQRYADALKGRDDGFAQIADKLRSGSEDEQPGHEPFDRDHPDPGRPAYHLPDLEESATEASHAQRRYEDTVSMLHDERTNAIKELQTLLAETQSHKTQLEGEVVTQTNRVTSLEDQLAATKDQVSSFIASYNANLQELQEVRQQLDAAQKMNDPALLQDLQDKLHKAELAGSRASLLDKRNTLLEDLVQKLRDQRDVLQTKAFEYNTNQNDIEAAKRAAEDALVHLQGQLTAERGEFARKSAEKAGLDRRLGDIHEIVQGLVGQRFYKFDEPRLIAADPVEAVRDISDDYQFFRTTYQQTATGLRDRIADLTRTLSNGSTKITQEHIQTRLDALKGLSEADQLKRAREVQVQNADDYAELLKKKMENGKVLASLFEAMVEWHGVEDKIRAILAPTGSIEHSQKAIEIVDKFLQLVKGTERRAKEEQRDGNVKSLMDSMIETYRITRFLLVHPANASTFVQGLKRLIKACEEVDRNGGVIADVLQSGSIKEELATGVRSYLQVFHLVNKDLLLEIVRSFHYSGDGSDRVDATPQGFGDLNTFSATNNSTISLDTEKEKLVLLNVTSIADLQRQLFPRLELLLLRISEHPVQTTLFFDVGKWDGLRPAQTSIKGPASAVSGWAPSLVESQGTWSGLGAYLYAKFVQHFQRASSPPSFLLPALSTTAPPDYQLGEAMVAICRFRLVQSSCNPAVQPWDEIENAFRPLFFKYGHPVGTLSSNEMLDDLFYLDTKKTPRKDMIQHVLVGIQNYLTTLTVSGGQRFQGGGTGDTIVDTSSVLPYDIRKLNAVLTRLNDMVIANLKDLSRAKASDLESGIYVERLKQLEQDLVSKESLLAQLDIVTKDSVQRALLTEQQLQLRHREFHDFCRMLLGRRKKGTLVFYDVGKNLFAFKRDGRAIDPSLDWASKLNLHPVNSKVRDLVDRERIEQLLSTRLPDLRPSSLEELIDSLVSSHMQFNASTSFGEEDEILQNVHDIAKTLKAIDTREREDSRVFEAGLEDLRELAQTWSEKKRGQAKKQANLRLFASARGRLLAPKREFVIELLDAMLANSQNAPGLNVWVEPLQNACKAARDHDWVQENYEQPILAPILDIKTDAPADDALLRLCRELLRLPKLSMELTPSTYDWAHLQEQRGACKEIINLRPLLTEVAAIRSESMALLQSVQQYQTAFDFIGGEEFWAGDGTADMAKMTALRENLSSSIRRLEFESALHKLYQAVVERLIGRQQIGGWLRPAAKEFIENVDRLLPTNLDADAGQSDENVGLVSYDQLIERVSQAKNRTQIDDVLRDLKRMEEAIANSDMEDLVEQAAVNAIAQLLLEDRMKCLNDMERMKLELGQELEHSESRLAEQRAEYGKQIHSANQKLVRSEKSEESSKGKGIAYGYKPRGEARTSPLPISEKDVPSISLTPEPTALVQDQSEFPKEDGDQHFEPESTEAKTDIAASDADDATPAVSSDDAEERAVLANENPPFDSDNADSAVPLPPQQNDKPQGEAQLSEESNMVLSAASPETNEWASLPVRPAGEVSEAKARKSAEWPSTTPGDFLFQRPTQEEIRVGISDILNSSRSAQLGGAVELGEAVETSMKLANIVRSKLLLLYLRFARMMSKPNLLRLFSTVENGPGHQGSFTGALLSIETPHRQSLSQFAKDLNLLVFVDVTDVRLPKQLLNLNTARQYEDNKKRHTMVYHRQLQALVPTDSASQRSVLRADYFCRLCLDFVKAVEDTQLDYELFEVGRSQRDPTVELSAMGLFLEQVLYLISVMQHQIEDANRIVNHSFLRDIRSLHLASATSDVLTYVRIRCDSDCLLWNERYCIGLLKNEDPPMQMIMQFNTHEFPYYAHDGNLEMVSEQATARLPHATTRWAIAEETPYQYHMMLGPFTRIFTPSETTRDIANMCDGIRRTLLEGKSVVMIGYGASGAGKTSSLICTTQGRSTSPTKPVCTELGVIPHLLLSREMLARYQTITFSACELTAFSPAGGKKTAVAGEGKVIWKAKDIPFKYRSDKDGERFVYEEPSTTRPMNANTIVEAGSKLDDIMRHFVEVDRVVRGTPMNPNSSRSHVLIFLKLDTGVSICLCDLAGVETEYACNDIETLLRMYNSSQCETPTNCVASYSEKIAAADEAAAALGQCGGMTKFTLHGACDSVPAERDEVQRLTSALRTTWGSKGLASLPKLLSAWRKISSWTDEKRNIGEMLFSDGKDEASSNIRLAQTGVVHVNALLTAQYQQRIALTVSMLSAAVHSDTPLAWGEALLDALRKYASLSSDNENYSPDVIARREIAKWVTHQKHQSKSPCCFVSIFGFDAAAFEQKAQEQSSRASWLADEIKAISKRLSPFFLLVQTRHSGGAGQTDNIQHINKKVYQFLTCLVSVHLDAFDSSYQTVRRMVSICKCRRHEGAYINSSLVQMRSVIRKLVQVQQEHQGKLETTPAFAELCLPMYCNPLQTRCLEADSSNTQEISEIVHVISRELGGIALQQMKVAIFTVFSMNRKAEADPSTPFVYAEGLRTEWNRLRNVEAMSELLREVHTYLEGDSREAVLKEFQEKTGGLDRVETQKHYLSVLTDIRRQVRRQQSRIGVSVVNKLESLIELANERSGPAIGRLLSEIDAINALHPIGTLIFTDSIAKNSTTDVVCSFSALSDSFASSLRDALENGQAFRNLISGKSLHLLPPRDPAPDPDEHSTKGGQLEFTATNTDDFLRQWYIHSGRKFTDFLKTVRPRTKVGASRRQTTRRPLPKRKSRTIL